MARVSKIYDDHTLYVKCGDATAEQISNAFYCALTTYLENSSDPIETDCRFRVQMVVNKQGQCLKKAFVYVTDSRIYYMLLGKNHDGTDRIEYREDSSFIVPSAGKIVNDAGWTTPLHKRMPRKIPINLPPLIVLPPVEIEGEKFHLLLDRATASTIDTQRFLPNVLKCKDLPEWLSRDDLKSFFTPYATSKVTGFTKYYKGVKIAEQYPIVNINKDRVAFIIFDPNTYDAHFALHMMKKFTINNTTLIFTHSFRTDKNDKSKFADTTAEQSVSSSSSVDNNPYSLLSS